MCSSDLQVTVTEAANVAPIARADARVIEGPGVATTFDVVANDSDPDDTDGGLEVVSAELATGEGTLTRTGSLVTITPAPDFVGLLPATYTIADGDGLTASSTVTLTVTEPANRPPVAVDDSTSIANGASTIVSVLANDSDPDGDDLQGLRELRDQLRGEREERRANSDLGGVYDEISEALDDLIDTERQSLSDREALADMQLGDPDTSDQDRRNAELAKESTVNKNMELGMMPDDLAGKRVCRDALLDEVRAALDARDGKPSELRLSSSPRAVFSNLCRGTFCAAHFPLCVSGREQSLQMKVAST